MKERIKEKAKTVFINCEETLVIAGAIFAGCGLGYIAGRKITLLKFDSGLSEVFRVKPEIQPLVDEAIKELKNGK